MLIGRSTEFRAASILESKSADILDRADLVTVNLEPVAKRYNRGVVQDVVFILLKIAPCSEYYAVHYAVRVPIGFGTRKYRPLIYLPQEGLLDRHPIPLKNAALKIVLIGRHNLNDQ